MRTITVAPLLLLLIAGTAGCKKYSGEKAAQQRQEWLKSLDDSISSLSARKEADSQRLEELRSLIADRLAAFTQVDNPREVEPYYILSRFRGSYPLSSTGIAARIMRNEQPELIAALKGARFNAVRAVSASRTATSATVPADQALNFTSGGLTTVAFTGAEADSICMLIGESKDAPLTLEYLQNGSVAGKITLSPEQKAWVADTWSLCAANREAHSLEKRQLTDSRKIEILKIKLQEQNERRTPIHP